MATTDSQQIKVWDTGVRLFHWSLAGAFFIAYISEDDWPLTHLYSGYLIGILLLFRLIWGFSGSRHARFRDFVYTPSTIIGYLKQAIRLRAPRHLGHNPAGGAMVLLLIAVLSITVISGIALYGIVDFSGPLAGLMRGEQAADVVEAIHETGANLTLLLIAVHLLGVAHSSIEHHENLVKSMITGLKRSN